MSFAHLSTVNLDVLVAAVGDVTGLLVMLALDRCGCKICENQELAGAALVIDIVAGATLVNLVVIKLVFRAV